MKKKLQIAVFVLFTGLAVFSLLPRLFTAQAETDFSQSNKPENRLPEIAADFFYVRQGFNIGSLRQTNGFGISFRYRTKPIKLN